MLFGKAQYTWLSVKLYPYNRLSKNVPVTCVLESRLGQWALRGGMSGSSGLSAEYLQSRLSIWLWEWEPDGENDRGRRLRCVDVRKQFYFTRMETSMGNSFQEDGIRNPNSRVEGCVSTMARVIRNYQISSLKVDSELPTIHARRLSRLIRDLDDNLADLLSRFQAPVSLTVFRERIHPINNRPNLVPRHRRKHCLEIQP